MMSERDLRPTLERQLANAEARAEAAEANLKGAEDRITTLRRERDAARERLKQAFNGPTPLRVLRDAKEASG